MLCLARRLTGCPVFSASLVPTTSRSSFIRSSVSCYDRAMSDSAGHKHKRAKVDGDDVTAAGAAAGGGAAAAAAGGASERPRPVRIAIEGNIGEYTCGGVRASSQCFASQCMTGLYIFLHHEGLCFNTLRTKPLFGRLVHVVAICYLASRLQCFAQSTSQRASMY